MKYLYVSILTMCMVACNSAQNKSNKASKSSMSRVDYANTITSEELKKHLYTFASDDMQGRMTGTEGQKKAAAYLRDFYIKEGIVAPTDAGYYQNIPAEYFKRARDKKASENVVAFIKGSEKPDEIIVLSAHYDHVGTNEEGEV